jgi:hypothetical protein
LAATDELIDLIDRDWQQAHKLIVTPLGNRAYFLKVKGLVSGEKPQLFSLREHDNITLFNVASYGTRKDRDLGYVLLFSGAPFVHHHTRYVALSYSEAEDVRTRQMKVIYDDDYVRLTRFGIQVFGYLLTCRKRTQEQLNVDVADHVAANMFANAWRDGI